MCAEAQRDMSITIQTRTEIFTNSYRIPSFLALTVGVDHLLVFSVTHYKTGYTTSPEEHAASIFTVILRPGACPPCCDAVILLLQAAL